MENPTSKRRRFLWQVIDEVIGVCETRAGRPSLKLSGLKDLPDEVLSEVVPSAVGAGTGAATEPIPALNLGAHPGWEELTACWDGERTLREISEFAVARKSISRQRAWDDTKALFFDLLSRGMTSPLNVPSSLRQP